MQAKYPSNADTVGDTSNTGINKFGDTGKVWVLCMSWVLIYTVYIVLQLQHMSKNAKAQSKPQAMPQLKHEKLLLYTYQKL